MSRLRAYPHTGDERAEDTRRAILVGIDTSDAKWPVEESLQELERLVHTAGAVTVGSVTQRLDRPNPRTFIGSGKVEEVLDAVRDASANLVVFDDELTPSQQANLEGMMPDVAVIDRTQLILDIFALHAVSREGKLQVELARLEYLLPRLRGMWGHLEKERLGGGRGARFGAGESQLEVDRRMARKRISELRRELRSVSAERELQRRRRAQSGVFRVALVGYTNAGKSTLLNALTGSQVLAYDMLFATLDATTRRLELPEGREVTITDTVGFINKLPHGLVEAFKSTLDEVNEADLLLHVTDAGATQRDQQMDAVREVLAEIGAQTRPGVVVFNKVDTIGPAERAHLERRYPGAILCSAQTGEGITSIVSRISDEAGRGSRTMTVSIPYTRGDLVRTAHERTQILSERHTPHGTDLVLRVGPDLVSLFGAFEAESAEEDGTPADR